MPITPVVFTGIDGTGKSPLIKMVQDYWPKSQGEPTVIRPPMAVEPPAKDSGEAFQYIHQERIKWPIYSGVWIYDRFPFPDELVYGGLEQPYPDTVRELYDNMMYRYGMKIVYVSPGDGQAYMDRMKEKPDEFFKTHEPKTFFKIMSFYQAIIERTKMKVHRVEGGRQLTSQDAIDAIQFIRRGKVG